MKSFIAKCFQLFANGLRRRKIMEETRSSEKAKPGKKKWEVKLKMVKTMRKVKIAKLVKITTWRTFKSLTDVAAKEEEKKRETPGASYGG